METATQLSHDGLVAEISGALNSLRFWVEEREYAGYEPYDLLNSPWLADIWTRSSILSSAMIQIGKRFGGVRLRRVLDVPPSHNPKALGLFLSGYCDLQRCGGEFDRHARLLKSELQRMRAPGEAEFSWGYDWNYVSLRGSVLGAFAANSIATVFCAEALADMADVFGDEQCWDIVQSACRFCVTRLPRSWDTADEVCFSYTPQSRTLIFNNSALIGALLARTGGRFNNPEYMNLALRSMNYLAARQRLDGAWTYGSGRLQHWVDGFHTGYNLCALAAYRRHSGDSRFDAVIARGYAFYKKQCFTKSGVPKYYADSLYPIDIHACTQAVLTFCDFVESDPDALNRAMSIAGWMLTHMRSPEGFFYYQRHRCWTNRTPYMRWAQAWTFRALARLLAVLKQRHEVTISDNWAK